MTIAENINNWEKNKVHYQNLEMEASYIIKSLLSENGLNARVLSRVKDTISIAKKILKKGNSCTDYTNLTDLVGIRIICRYKKDISTVAKIIKRKFIVIKVEDKSSLLEIDRIGYKSMHFDFSLASDRIDKLYTDIDDLVGEIQLRTLCEDVWAEVNHDIGYKSLGELPKLIARRIFCLGGLLETADDTIDEIETQSQKSIKLSSFVVLNYLESEYLKVYPQIYDKELSEITINELIKPFIKWKFKRFRVTITEYFSKNIAKFKQLIVDREKKLAEMLFITQPEFILIAFMINNYPFDLVNHWPEVYSQKALKTVGIWWGVPLDSYINEE